MSLLFAAEPILASADLRPRLAPGQATILPDSTIPARRAGLASGNKSRERQRRNAPPAAPELPAGAMFAAAVAAETVPPQPESREEQVRRLDRGRTRQRTGIALPDRRA